MSGRYQTPPKKTSREERGLFREPGGIFLKESPSIRQQVEAAYLKAEKEQWNTQKERSEGHTRWTSEQAINAALEDGDHDGGKQLRWTNYRNKRQPG